MCWQERRFIEDASIYLENLVEFLMIAEEIIEKLNISLEELYAKEEKRTYYDDPDDPPVPRCSEEFQFIECDNYMTTEGLVKWDLNYMINKMNHWTCLQDFHYAEDRTPDLPREEYVWYVCPMDRGVDQVQEAYYYNWYHYNTMDKLSKEQMDNILKMDKQEAIDLLKDWKEWYDLHSADIIWAVWGQNMVIYGMNALNF
jgi:hypothetical protein